MNTWRSEKTTTQLIKKRKANIDIEEIIFINFDTYWSLAEQGHHRTKSMCMLPEWAGEQTGSCSRESLDSQAYMSSPHILIYDVQKCQKPIRGLKYSFKNDRTKEE